jgi:hypothetical protein
MSDLIWRCSAIILSCIRFMALAIDHSSRPAEGEK